MKKIGILLVILASVVGSKSFGQEASDGKSKVAIYSIFINIVPDHFNYPLIGLVNIGNGNQQSTHIGFLNRTQRNFGGEQISFINTVGESVNGNQLGFINLCGDSLNGSQVGFINSTKKLNSGFQLGFINFADTVTDGIPIGFLSIVRKGGFQAVEVSCTETYPLNVSYKIGIKQFYTTLIASYNSNLNKQFALGGGFGSIIPVSRTVYFNPELVSQNVLGENNQQLMSLTTNFGLTITKRIHILAGPSVVWNHTDKNTELNKPFYSIYTTDFNDKNKLLVGCRLALRYTISNSF